MGRVCGGHVCIQSHTSNEKNAVENKFGTIFSWVFMDFFKSQPKRWNFDQNRINFTKILVVLTKKKKKKNFFYLIIKMKACSFWFSASFHKKLTLSKNFWQCLEQNEIQPICQKNAVLLI